jgi:steroid delta-isomerase-like uncharacterized protein
MLRRLAPLDALEEGSNSHKGESRMSIEDNKALVRRWIEALNQKNLAAFDGLCAPDFVHHSPSMTVQGLEAYKQAISGEFTAFPDMRFTIEDMLAEGDTIAVRLTGHGTHQGNLQGIPPTGKQATIPGMTIYRIAGGKLAEQWESLDDLGLLQQLGVIPAMGQAG